MKFLVDTQLPRVIAESVRAAGHEAVHVLDLGLAQSPDNALWNHAMREGLVILTKDEDFAQWVLTGRKGPQVVWLRIGNCSNAELASWLEPVWPTIVSAILQGDRLVEIQ